MPSVLDMLPYHLASQTAAHDQDIKATVLIPPFDGQLGSYFVLTCSRDKSVKLWKVSENLSSATNKDQNTLQCLLEKEYHHHTHFVNALAYYPPSAVYELGLILSAGSDKIIYVYPPNVDFSNWNSVKDSNDPLFALIGHEDNICSLFVTERGKILSSSWDKTARVWEDWKCLFVLRGHKSAVWSVISLSNGNIVTGSADLTIKMWQRDTCIATLTGHTDVVRQLVILPFSGFASCSNDCTVRVWSEDGQCLRELIGHNAFIYALAVFPNGDLVSAGEDRSVRIWRDAHCVQTLKYPTNSIWSLSVCPFSQFENDLFVAGSDGMLRIFTTLKKRFASGETLAAYDAVLDSLSITSNELGDIDIASLPGPEALSIPGKREGAVLVIKTPVGNIEAHQWSELSKEWVKVGDVVHSTSNPSKQIFEGKEYDYVFKIDIEDGKPSLPLPYNISQNPYAAAQNFIHSHQLPVSYLDEISNFIIKNTSNHTLTQSKTFTENIYKDPSKTENDFISFKAVNMSGIMKKLREFNGSLIGRNEGFLSESDLVNIEKWLHSCSTGEFSENNATSFSIGTLLWKALRGWSDEFIFPVLDLIRLVPIEESLLVTMQHDPLQLDLNVLDKLNDIASLKNEQKEDGKTIHGRNSKCIGRFIVNLFCTPFGRTMLIDQIDKIELIYNNVKRFIDDVQILKAFEENFRKLSKSKASLLSYEKRMFGLMDA